MITTSAETGTYASSHAETTRTASQRLLQKAKKWGGAVLNFFKPEEDTWHAEYRQPQRSRTDNYRDVLERERATRSRLKAVYSSMAIDTLDRFGPAKRPGVLRGVKGPARAQGVLIEECRSDEPWPTDSSVPRTSIYHAVLMDGVTPMIMQRVFCPTVDDSLVIYPSFGHFDQNDRFVPKHTAAGSLATDKDLFELRAAYGMLEQQRPAARSQTVV